MITRGSCKGEQMGEKQQWPWCGVLQLFIFLKCFFSFAFSKKKRERKLVYRRLSMPPQLQKGSLLCVCFAIAEQIELRGNKTNSSVTGLCTFKGIAAHVGAYSFLSSQGFLFFKKTELGSEKETPSIRRAKECRQPGLRTDQRLRGTAQTSETMAIALQTCRRSLDLTEGPGQMGLEVANISKSPVTPVSTSAAFLAWKLGRKQAAHANVSQYV